MFINNATETGEIINKKHDTIIVLTGAKGRIDAGLELLSKQHADSLFVSGVGANAALEDLSKYLVSFKEHQIHPLKSSITLGHAASSTEENAKETLAWVQNNGFKNIILVTSDYHMPRSLYLFEQAMPDIKITTYPVISYASLKLFFTEYNKYLLTIIAI